MKQLAIINLLLLFTMSILGQQTKPLQPHSKNPHYFLYHNKPTILIGSGEHYGGVINLGFDYKKYLQTLAEDGLNITRIFAGSYIEKTGDFDIQKNTLAPAEGQLILPWRRSNVGGFALGGNKFDLDTWDENYFTRLKDFINKASVAGVIVEVNLFSSYYLAGWNYSAFNPKNNINHTDNIAPGMVNTLQNGNIIDYQERYVRKIVKELNGFGNFYFEIQNEPWADQTDTILTQNEYSDVKDWRSKIEVVSKRSNDWQRQVARWIKGEEANLPNKHLISQNISNFHYPITNADPNVSIFNFHYALPKTVWENYHLNKVIGFNETGFAGHADITYHRQAWKFVMAGGGLFNHLDYSFSVGSEIGRDTGYSAPGGGSSALRKQLSTLKHFFERQNFITLRPDHLIVASAAGAMTEALSDGHTQWIIYYEPLSMGSHELSLNLPVARYKAEWTDVVTGAILKIAIITKGQLEVPAGANDKVLLIKVAAAK
ncbi:MAG: hypothetical protein ABJA71_00685 [Ginsengibacter sp.]